MFSKTGLCLLIHRPVNKKWLCHFTKQDLKPKIY